MRKIRLAIMADAFDRRPENTLFSRRLIEAIIAVPYIDLTLVHFKSMPNEPLYKQAHEVLIKPMRLPFAGHFFAFLRYCLTTKDEFDIVHSFTARLYPFFWLFPAKHRIVMAHGGGERLAPGAWTFPRFVFVWNLILFQKHVDILIGVSEYANKEIVYAFHVPPEKVRTIYPYLDETYTRPLSDKTVADTLTTYGLTSGNYFTYIGRFRTHKNVGNLIEAYLRYREHNPKATELLAVGGGTKQEYESVFGKIRSSPFTGDIHFLGHIPNDHMPVLYKGARALAFVTLNEGFGVPIIEAMACGTPVITSSATSMPEVAGDAAIIIDPHDPDALAETFQLLSKNATLRAELIRRGNARYKLFTWEKVVQETFNLYRILTEEKSSIYNPVSDISNI